MKGGHPAHQRSRSNKHPTHMVIHTYTDKQTQMNGPGQGPECWEWKWGNISEGLQEVAVTEEVGRRSRVRAFRFPRARAKGSRCLGLPLGVWIELREDSRRTKNQQKPLVFQHFQHGSFKNQWFFNILRPREVPGNRKTNKKRRFFNIFNMDASKTSGFSTF